MINLILCLIAQIQVQNDIRHNEYAFLSGKTSTEIVLRGGQPEPIQAVKDYLSGKPWEGQILKRIRPEQVENGSIFLHQKFFSGTPGWNCYFQGGVINQPKIYGAYWDGELVIWGVNLGDTYGSTTKIYEVTEIREVPRLRARGDQQGTQAYYEDPYLIRVKPAGSRLVVYSGECGPYGMAQVEVPPKRAEKRVLSYKDYPSRDELLAAALRERANIYLGDIDRISLPDGVGLVGGSAKQVIMGEGSDLIGVSLEGDDFLVQLKSNNLVSKCSLNALGENACFITKDSISNTTIKDCSLMGVRGFQVQYGASKTYKNIITLRCTFEGSRFNNSVSGFILGDSCVVADCKVSSFRGLFGQSNSGPVVHNLIARNEFIDGGFNNGGGEQLLLEHKVGRKVNTIDFPCVGQTLYVESGPGMGQYGIITEFNSITKQIKLDRPVLMTEDSLYSVGLFGTENLFLENRVVRARTGLMYWVSTIGNICSGHTSYDVQVGFNQNADSTHGMASHNLIRDSLFFRSPLIFANKEGPMVGFRMCRTDVVDSPVRMYGQNVFLILNKVSFHLADPFPIGGYDQTLDFSAQKLPYPPLYGSFTGKALSVRRDGILVGFDKLTSQ